MNPTPTDDGDWLNPYATPATALATVERLDSRRPPPVDHAEELAGDAQAYALIEFIRANPVISWHSTCARDWCRRHGLPTKGAAHADFMARVRQLFADSAAEQTREVIARLVTSAEDIRLHAMAGAEPDLPTALGCLRLQSDLLVPKKLAVAHAFLTPPTEAGRIAADINRLTAAELEALAKRARDRETERRRTAEAAARAAVAAEVDDED
jgi:hypothetical protein